MNVRRGIVSFLCALRLVSGVLSSASTMVDSQTSQPVVIVSVDGSINPATDDFLRTSIRAAETSGARLLVIRLSTPGGLLTSMQKMVEGLLEAPVPTVVYVSPRGASAMSAGVFITLAGHFAAMSPGTTIGAAHPVMAGGQDVTGDMREKVENSAVSMIKAVAEQRGRNIAWAEKAVRESVAITDREALEQKVIDFVAGDLDELLTMMEGKTVSVRGQARTLSGLNSAPRVDLAMTFKQKVVNLLSDPNIAILLGLGAMLGIGIELYHPGALFPGVFGVICLVLTLTAGQIIPINMGGAALLLLAAVFFVLELLVPSFGIWGGAGIICLVLGSIYLIDTEMVWGIEGFDVNTGLVGSIAAFVGLCLLGLGYVVVKCRTSRIETGKEGLSGKLGKAVDDFHADKESDSLHGRVYASGEIWKARCPLSKAAGIAAGSRIRVLELEEGMTLLVEPWAEGRDG